jgi:2-polyprenyl-3-methyl-5-hydroxy-6-metoxy-1,4-benzoquinol methylase
MDETSASKPRGGQSHYDSNYGNFKTELYAQIRRDAFGEDIGQNSWHTAEEQAQFLRWLELSGDKKLLDVACGAGGPALRIAAATGCSVVGVDIHEQAIAAASSLAAERGLSERAEFRVVNASAQLPFPDASFDAITCIDAINHLPDRPRVIAEWVRLLRTGGRLLFTDPITMTGPLTNAEIAIRSSAGVYVFVPHGYDESVLQQAGLQLLASEDVTGNMAAVAERRRAARASRSSALTQIEGAAAYEAQQEYLALASRIAHEGRLSRFVYVAKKIT